VVPALLEVTSLTACSSKAHGTLRSAETMGQQDSHSNGARLSIDLTALTANYLLLREKAAPARVAAVVKADAYGLGARRVAATLQEAGCSDFFVAHLAEAEALLPHVRGATLYVLNGLQPGAEAMCAALGILPVINSLDQARRWADIAAAMGRALPAALQVDSGMSRLGLPDTEVDELACWSDWFDLVDVRLIMSHLACADEPAHPANQMQRKRFEALASRLPPAPLSLANSAAIYLPSEFHHDLVRPGLAIYGVGAPHGHALHRVMKVDARVIQVRSVESGTGVGYGLSFKARRPTRVATIALGYADGWPRQLSNRGAAYCGGVRLPFAGRVSMDTILLDVTDLPEEALGLGDYVELIGDHQSVEDVAADAATIPYEILTGLGHRFHRVYSTLAATGAQHGGASQ